MSLDTVAVLVLVALGLVVLVGLYEQARVLKRQARAKAEAQLDIAGDLEKIERGSTQDFDKRLDQAIQEWESKEHPE